MSHYARSDHEIIVPLIAWHDRGFGGSLVRLLRLLYG